MILTPVKTINNLSIYKRNRKHETWLPLYVVFAPDGRELEEFRRLKSAEKWATKTTDFVVTPCTT